MVDMEEHRPAGPQRDRPRWLPRSRARGPLPTPSAATGRASYLTAAATLGLLALALAVHLGVTEGFDAGVRQFARPNDVWGPLQRRADLVVEGLRPSVVVVLLVIFGGVVSLVRRSVRSLVELSATCWPTMTRRPMAREPASSTSSGSCIRTLAERCEPSR